MIPYCFVCKLPVQAATTFQKVHVLNLDFNSHDEIQNFNNNYLYGRMWVPFNIRNKWVPCSFMRALWKTFLISATWKRFLVIKLMLLTWLLYVYMICRNFVWNATVWNYLFMTFFISGSKSQVYGMLHRVFFKLRGIKEHRYCLIIVFSMHVDSFSHQ